MLVAFTDMQGRLVGKRISARLFREEVADHGAEACNYLLAVDVEMNTVSGYAMSSWERGYGDMAMMPDLDTLRLVPWLPGTAMVTADLTWLDGAPVAPSPRAILRAQIDRLAERGLVPYVGTELEFLVFDDSYRDAWAKNYTALTPASDYNIDYAVLASTRMEPLLRDIRTRDGRRRDVRRRGQGGVQPRVSRRSGSGTTTRSSPRQPLRSTRTVRRRSPTSTARRSPSWRSSTSAKATAATSTSACAARDGSAVLADPERPYGFSPMMEHFIAGQLATLRELTLLFAPNINSYKRYVPGSFAPTAVAWGVDNRTCALRLVGRGLGLRVENRVPGGDVNQYLAIAALIAGGLHGIENELPLEPETAGNAYTQRRRARAIDAAGGRRPLCPVARRPRGIRRRSRRTLPEQRPCRAGLIRGRRHRLGAHPWF